MARATTTSDVFNAIAEPRRRAILDYLAEAERSVGEVAEALRMGQPSASKHLAVLKQVRMVAERRVGRRILYRTEPESIKPIHDWASRFERFWTRQLHDIKRIAEKKAARSGSDRAPEHPKGETS